MAIVSRRNALYCTRRNSSNDYHITPTLGGFFLPEQFRHCTENIVSSRPRRHSWMRRIHDRSGRRADLIKQPLSLPLLIPITTGLFLDEITLIIYMFGVKKKMESKKSQ